MRLRPLRTAAIVTLATLCAGAYGKPILNPCSLLNEQEVAAVLGTPVKTSSLDVFDLCLYNNGAGVPVFSVRGSIHANKYDAYLEMQDFANVAPRIFQEAVSGLGDHAEILTNRQGDLILVIQKQANLLAISLLHTAGPDIQTRKLALEQAGRQAAARL